MEILCIGKTLVGQRYIMQPSSTHHTKVKYYSYGKGLDHREYGLELNWEDQIVYKETLLSIECLGKNTKANKKESWDQDMKKRVEIVKYFKQRLFFDINIYVTGKNTIDFVEIGKDKGSNISRLSKLVDIDLENIEYFGDEFSKYGNDYPILDIGVRIHKVENPDETLAILEALI